MNNHQHLLVEVRIRTKHITWEERQPLVSSFRFKVKIKADNYIYICTCDFQTYLLFLYSVIFTSLRFCLCRIL